MDQETARYMVTLNNEIDRLWRYLDHDKNARELRATARDIEGKTAGYKKELEDSFRQQYQESSRYFNTVMAVGYAGYFTAWTLLRNDIEPWHSAFVGLMGLMSLSLFIGWELLSMHTRFRAMSELNTLFRDMISVHDFEPMRRRQLSLEAQRMRFFRPIWVMVFAGSTGAAAIGGLVMMHQMVKLLWVT